MRGGDLNHSPPQSSQRKWERGEIWTLIFLIKKSGQYQDSRHFLSEILFNLILQNESFILEGLIV